MFTNPCQNPLHEGQFRLRVNKVIRCRSMRLETCQNGYQYGTEIRIKILNINIDFPPPYCTSIRNPSGIDIVYNAGLHRWKQADTVLIPYGRGSKSGCVTVFTEWIVGCSDPCGPASNS